MKIEYGIPKLYLVKPKTDGSITKEEFTVVSLVDNILTLSGSVTVVDVGATVVLHQVNQNNYTFGKLTSATTVELHDDADTYFIANGISMKIMAGMGVASFESCEILLDESGITYKGQYAYDRASNYTDSEAKFTLTNVVFTSDFIEFVNNAQSIAFGDGKAMSVSDFSVGTDKEIRPNDLTLIAIKRRKENDDLYEEFYIPRAKSGSLELPAKRDAYATLTYEFTMNTKSSGSGDVLDYNIEL